MPALLWALGILPSGAYALEVLAMTFRDRERLGVRWHEVGLWPKSISAHHLLGVELCAPERIR